ncbi:MAG: hypothetical protein LBC71_08325 [Oscillospiraceae bacterium]|jgi:hypothetical protein|nr:hypothetical protein [Oscillospiraceae bacterium]
MINPSQANNENIAYLKFCFKAIENNRSNTNHKASVIMIVVALLLNICITSMYKVIDDNAHTSIMGIIFFVVIILIKILTKIIMS